MPQFWAAKNGAQLGQTLIAQQKSSARIVAMNKPHQHADWIKRWADGEALEWQDMFGQEADEWQAVTPRHQWHEMGVRYRCAPPHREVRLFVSRAFDHPVMATSREHAAECELSPLFAGWITQWIEYE
jgi:hypothetical protein